MASLEIFQFAYNADNYGVLLHCPDSGDTACIDAGDASATEAALAQIERAHRAGARFNSRTTIRRRWSPSFLPMSFPASYYYYYQAT